MPAVHRFSARPAKGLHDPPVVRRQHARVEPVPPDRHHRPGHRTRHRRRPGLDHRRRRLPAAARLRKNLPDRLPSDHESLQHGLRLPKTGLQDLHPLPGGTLPLLQQPHHRRHTAPPPKRRHNTSSLPPIRQHHT
ncbi:hypothetical protein SBRY_30437 [Actinacidiphila bryophytorum]|uniref:Uncharacterized protein n=1 Tax=Actinacidiphila bryophytorum TaxID=1436133 RepID=A0A9W4H106_9ACTN|nr:hypothetical protein SBRY_30437 [Actinacidiphila bryophytorum]